MLRRASSSEDTYNDGRERIIESVKCTTTSWRGLASCYKPWVEAEYSIPEFLKAKEDVAQ